MTVSAGSTSTLRPPLVLLPESETSAATATGCLYARSDKLGWENQGPPPAETSLREDTATCFVRGKRKAYPAGDEAQVIA